MTRRRTVGGGLDDVRVPGGLPEPRLRGPQERCFLRGGLLAPSQDPRGKPLGSGSPASPPEAGGLLQLLRSGGSVCAGLRPSLVPIFDLRKRGKCSVTKEMTLEGTKARTVSWGCTTAPTAPCSAS